MGKAYQKGTSIQFWRAGTWNPGTFVEDIDKDYSKVYTQMGLEKMHKSKIKLKF